MIKKPAVMMHLPEGKLPGFYAQIVKALANKTQLFDRDKELLIVSSDEEAAAVKDVLDRFNIGYEDLELVLLPDKKKLFAVADDLGFQARSGHYYLYAHLVVFFRFKAVQNDLTARSQAYLQMREHLAVVFEFQGHSCYAVERHLENLIPGIAGAYSCEVEFIGL